MPRLTESHRRCGRGMARDGAGWCGATFVRDARAIRGGSSVATSGETGRYGMALFGASAGMAFLLFKGRGCRQRSMVDDVPRNTGPPGGWKSANSVWTLLHPCCLKHHEGIGFSIGKGRKCPIETNHVTSPIVGMRTNKTR
jgi:hypothetical protein